MSRKTSYLFDETIAPLTVEEKQIIKEHRILSIKVNMIYERTDKVIKLHKKTEKEKDKKRKRKEDEERIQLYKKQKQEKELLEKQELCKNTECFKQNYTEFKQEFYKLFDQVKLLRSNFECTKDKVNEIKKFSKKFSNKCIHPECFKTIGYYSYLVNDGGGSGFGSSTYQKRECNACNICKQQDNIKDQSWNEYEKCWDKDENLEFSKYKDFDSEDNINKLNRDLNLLNRL